MLSAWYQSLLVAGRKMRGKLTSALKTEVWALLIAFLILALV